MKLVLSASCISSRLLTSFPTIFKSVGASSSHVRHLPCFIPRTVNTVQVGGGPIRIGVWFHRAAAGVLYLEYP